MYLGFVTFFELSRVGEVQVVDKVVRVGAVVEASPFSKAGIRVGDVIAEVNDY